MMTITDLINNDTIVPVTQEERFSSLPPAWMIYEVLKWGDWYISPIGSNGEVPRHQSMVFVTAIIPNGYVHVPMSRQCVRHDPEYAKKLIRQQIERLMDSNDGLARG